MDSAKLSTPLGRRVTRFAPSPTGALHLGGARTALFNWLFARAWGGHFYLRFEDTDPVRSKPEFEQDILRSINWLELNPDAEPIRQSERTALYAEVAGRLVASGHAYFCNCSPERLESLRQRARLEGGQKGQVYDGLCRNKALPDTPDSVLRLNAESAAACQSTVSLEQPVPTEDYILRRSRQEGEAAGGFTYHLCCVVDDHDTGVTHIIRGADHIDSEWKQRLLYGCLSWDMPEVQHLPLVLAPDGSRLSKRNHAMPIESLRAAGYLPEAVCNYLVRMGWSYGDQEFFKDLPAVAAVFLQGSIGASASKSDMERLKSLNFQHAQSLEPQELAERYFQWRQHYSRQDAASVAKLHLTPMVVASFFERVQTFEQLDANLCSLSELHQQSEPPRFDEAELDVLRTCAEVLAKVDPFQPEDINASLRQLIRAKGISFKQLGMPLRLALTGEKQSPAVHMVCSALGREVVLSRLARVAGF